ncbi:hypothetical protein D3C85_1425240 [compost metagenome]
MDKLHGDAGAVGDDGRSQLPGQLTCQLHIGGAAVEKHYLARLDQPGAGLSQPDFHRRAYLLAGAEVRDHRGDGQGPAVDPLQQPFTGKFTQIAPDCIL